MKKSTYSNEIEKAVEQFLKEKNRHFDFLEKAGLFKFDLKISSKIRKIKYVIDVKNDELVVYGICPVHADEKDEEVMAQMSEFLHRANYGLKNGCFSHSLQTEVCRHNQYNFGNRFLHPRNQTQNSHLLYGCHV